MRLQGRYKIYTSYDEINRDNILEVLQSAYSVHRKNVSEINYLMKYERGEQPLKRQKKIRSDIDIRVHSNVANYVKEFKLSYNWSSPIMLVQRGDAEMHKDSDPKLDDTGITALNELLRNAEDISYKDLCVGEFVEICGIGHKMVDIRTDFEGTESLFHVYSLDSRNTFCVYNDGVGEKKVLGVTYTKSYDGKLRFTCISKDTVYTIIGEDIIEQRNPFGMINIIEYERSYDRTGCFERSISEIDALNIEMSDYTNDVAQRTQEIWWGNDIDFPVDEKTGKAIKPVSGQWLLTYSGEGKNPKIQPMSDTFNGMSVLDSISSKRKTIFQDCKVPIQYESSGGGSTGTATDMSSGWSATELDAMREQQFTERSKREELALILKAITFVPTSILPVDDPIRSVHLSDVDFHFNRRKNYDMSIKANTFATYVAHGIHGRHALKVIDAFEDTEQVYNDSKELIEKFQENAFAKEQTSNDGLIMSDNSDQTGNSPILDGLTVERDEK